MVEKSSWFIFEQTPWINNGGLSIWGIEKMSISQKYDQIIQKYIWVEPINLIQIFKKNYCVHEIYKFWIYFSNHSIIINHLPDSQTYLCLNFYTSFSTAKFKYLTSYSPLVFRINFNIFHSHNHYSISI